MKKNELQQLAITEPERVVDYCAEQIALQANFCDYEIYAHCLLKLDRIDEAKKSYYQILQKNNTDPRVHFGLAQALQKSQEFSSALIHLQYCLEAHPNQITFLFQAGTCHLQLGERDLAKKFLEQVLAQNPLHLEALVNLASCFIYEKNWAQAIHYLATACRIDENYLPAQYNLACALMEFKRFAQARNQFELYLKKIDDPEARYHLGFVYLMLDELEQAQSCFQQILRAEPNHLLSMHNLANIALKQKKTSVSLGYYQRILSITTSDEIALYMTAALAQKTPPAQAPEAYIKALFDQYADRFDQHLTQDLNYQTPQLLHQLWQKYEQPQQKKYSILDLGCGTGLIGALFKPHASELIGVDLSEQMLQHAEKKSLYDALHETEILTYLTTQKKIYDLVILSDVLVYFGDLTNLFNILSQRSHRWLFSIESTKEKDCLLSVSGRYQHRLEPLLKLITQQGFEYKVERQVTLRNQNNQAVLGDLVFSYKN